MNTRRDECCPFPLVLLQDQFVTTAGIVPTTIAQTHNKHKSRLRQSHSKHTEGKSDNRERRSKQSKYNLPIYSDTVETCGLAFNENTHI